VTGALDTTWDPNLAGGGPNVFNISINSSLIYVVGSFATTNGTARGNGACYATDGTLQAWDPLSNVRIDSILFDSTRAFLGGAPMTLNGTLRGSLAAVSKTTGAYDSSFVPVTATGGSQDIQNMTILNGNIYFGGSFTAINGSGRNYVAAVSTAGAIQSWNPNANNQVVGMDSDGVDTLYFHGLFTTIGGVSQPYGAAMTTSGTLQSWPTAPAYGSAADGTRVYTDFGIVVCSPNTEQFIREVVQ
jgi:hypothetical protein